VLWEHIWHGKTEKKKRKENGEGPDMGDEVNFVNKYPRK